MKKSKLIFISAFVIVIFTSNVAFSFDVKSIIDSAKEILGISKASPPSQVKPAPAKAPAPDKNQPAPAAGTKAPAQSQAKPASTSTAAVTDQGKTKPAPAAGTKAPATNQVSPAPSGTAVQAQDKDRPVPASPWASTSTESYSYNPAGKTDPFRPFIVVETAVKKPIDSKPTPTSIYPLQRAEADSYKVVGIAGSEDGRVAIVEDVGKKFYPLSKGTRIGLHNGKVVEIMADRVVVEEYDNKKVKRVYLKLRKN
jgi:type IV pilus assembly protein PilP